MSNHDEVRDFSRSILEYWFSSIDDRSSLDPQAEPFRTCSARWYGKRQEIDDEIRARFEPALKHVVQDGRRWDAEFAEWRRAPQGLLALTILLDQFPRNMYRGTAAMYAHDALALLVATEGMRDYEDQPLPLVQRTFLYLPLMHVENLTLQENMLLRFENLLTLAASRSPHNASFFEMGVDYARRHHEIVARFGRFPHRNAILGRLSTAEELEFLTRDGSAF